MHSREVWGLTAGMLGITAAAGLAGLWLWGAGAAALLWLLGGLLTALAAAFTLWRYRQIGALCRYLAGVYAGGEAVDIRDQRPGELGALKDDLYKITTVLRRQAADLQRQKAFLSETLENIAHQLKTPLAAIQLQTELWQSPGTGQAQRARCAAEAARQVERMDWLVKSLLKLSRLEADAVPFERRELPAAEVIRRAARGLLPLLGRRQVELAVHCPQDDLCRCDPAWTAEALTNLIKNCAEHTPPGGRVSVHFAATVLFDEFRVEDTGGGIPAAALPHIFERFWRGPGSPPGSAGIGLPLARAVAQGQNGALTAANTAEGACFTLRLFR